MAATREWAARIMLLAAVAALVVVGVGPTTGRYRLTTVLSGSMGRGMPVGSVAVLVPMRPADVRVGDVITFQAPTADRHVVTHRVVEIVEPGPHPLLRTKGDANSVPDPWEARLTGSPAWRRVAVVPVVGKLIRALRSPPLHHATVQIVPLILLGVMLRSIWGDALFRPVRRRLSLPARRAVIALGAVVVMVVGPIPLRMTAAWASFTSAPTASPVYSTLSLSAPVLDCDPGGVLHSTVDLNWTSADDVADPYSAGNYRISGYTIERTAANGSTYSTLATVGRVGTYSDNPSGILGTYKYRIKSTKGNWVSPVSNIVTASVTNVLFVGISVTCTA